MQTQIFVQKCKTKMKTIFDRKKIEKNTQRIKLKIKFSYLLLVYNRKYVPIILYYLTLFYLL